MNSTLTAYGNFDVRIDFTNADLLHMSGRIGNQAQLNCFFDIFNSVTNFSVVRSNESGKGTNVHVWVTTTNGGFQLSNYISVTATSGTLRVTRTNSSLTGYFNSKPIAYTDFLADPVHFQIVLQNNDTADAISITYKNFQLTADQITVGPSLNIQNQLPGNAVISWPTWNVGWTTNYILEYADSLQSSSWTPSGIKPTKDGGEFILTNAVTLLPNFSCWNRTSS